MMAGRRDDRRRSWGISFWALTTIAICILYPVTAFGLVPVALHHGNTIIQQPRGSARCLSSNKKVRGVETAPSFQWNHACSGHSAIRTPSQLGMLASPLLVDEMLQSASSLLVSAVAEDVASTAAMDPLMVYFWQTVIANGIPAAFAVAVIGFTALQFRGNGKKDNADSVSSSSLGSTIAARQLYDDLYADQDQDPFRRGNRNGMPFFGGNDRNKPKNNKNTGVPKQQYLTVTHLNQKYDSFAYSLTASTQGKAVAAANYRQRAWQRAWNAQYESLPPSVVRELYQLEATFLNSVASKQAELLTYQTQLQKLSMVQQMEKMGMENVYQIDPPTDGWQGMNSTENATSTSSSSSSLSSSKTKSPSVSMSSMTALQASLVTLENDFCRDVMTTVGPTHAASIYAAILGKGSLSMASMSATGVRPLTFLLGGDSDAVDSSSKPSGRVYVTRFPGDPTASQVANLREEVTAIVQNSRQSNGGDRNHNDQVVVVLQTGGGTVTGYGLAAAQLQRLKDANLYLTICVEQVAASGGYMMACIADKIVASPFAVLGSIGVISDIPNVYNRLKQEGIEFQTVTAGKYKRTLTPTKKVTSEDFQKTKQDIEDIFYLFRDFVAKNRPQLDIEKVATGETWFGTAAMELNLCDEIKTVDDVVLDFINDGFNVYEVKYKPPVPETFLGQLLPVESESSTSSNVDSSGGPVATLVRWITRTAAEAVRAELSQSLNAMTSEKPVEERYMAVDDTANRVRSQE